MATSVFEPFTVEDAGLRVELLVQPAINYALVHNRVPLVRQVTLTNLSDTALTDLDVRLELHGPDGPLAPVWERTVATVFRPDATTGWEDLTDFGPDMARLRATDEAFPIEYLLTVTRPDQTTVRLTAPSRVLAHNEWFNSPTLYDLLAAFVQPNTAAVETVLRAATKILLARTGSGSLQGYQAGPERAARIAGAVYEALRQLGIHYQALPASFENTGQKVRTTAAVLAGGLGNCVDLSVTYAACLEQAGLRPLIWLTDNHAFAGFLLEEERLESAVVAESNLLISMVESGKVVPVELTRVSPGVQSVDFAEAVRLGVRHFRSSGQSLQGVVDVYLAHRSGIRPLPSTDSAATDPVTTSPPVAVGKGAIELPDGVARALLRQRAAVGDDAPQQSDDSPPRVQRWKKALLDLSLRNPLLNLPTRGKGLDLHVPAGTLATLDDVIHSGKRLDVVPQDAISHLHELAGARRAQELEPEVLTRELRADKRIYGAVSEQRYQATMRGLQRDARTMEQETGSNYLYLTIGTLAHPKTTGGEAHAPLFLLPVRVEGGTGRRLYHLVIDGSEIATPNYCLVEWLRVRHRVRIPELEQPMRDEHGIDIPLTLAAIRKHLVDNNLNYRIDETASLRLLQFSTFQMWRDLTDHWQTFMENPVVRHLVRNPGASFDDPAGDETSPDVDEGHLHLPIAADGSQMQAITLAERGYSFVLEGPPGTGKSQTITNMIARALHAGRSVLFVAEKQAALDVVKRRLESVGLARFVLDLHGRKQSLNAIRQQLREALDQEGRDDDATWTAVETSYRARLAPLAKYPERVHTANAAGLSAWTAYESLLAWGDGVTAPVPVTYLNTDDDLRRRVEHALPEFPAVAHSARLRADHPWVLCGRRDVDGLSPETVVHIASDLEKARLALADDARLAAIVCALPDPEEVTRFLPAASLAVRGLLPDRGTTTRAMGQGWDEAISRTKARLTSFRQAYAVELAAFHPNVFTVQDLDLWHQEAREAGKRIFGKRKALQKVAERLSPYLATSSPLDAEAVERTLGRLIEARTHAGDLYREVTDAGGLLLPHGWLPTPPDAPGQLDQAYQETATSRALLASNPAMWDLLSGGFGTAGLDLLQRLVSAWRAWRGVLATGPDEFAFWAGAGWYDTWQRHGSTWLVGVRDEGLLPIQRWAAVLANTDVLTAAGLLEFREQLLRAVVDPDAAEEAYRRGVATTALTERLRAGGVEFFDPDLHDTSIAQYATVSGNLRDALPERLPSVLTRRRPFQPTERRGRVADFTAELRRKRGGRSFRELFTAYPDVVLALTPCVLVSPASAANFLAPGATRFDLVIFDEASQIRVAEAIGAMGRGRSVVVVGDSQQMPPTSIMQASHEDEETKPDTEPVLVDLDSILSETVESGLPQRWLSWHYRSNDESLIAFSNRHYYDNNLCSLPSPGAAETTGVRWRRVDGQFDRAGTRTNLVEAREIVAEIGRRLRQLDTRDESIGVVTFNIQQRDLILDLLEDSTDPLIREWISEEATEPLFVKNLENVQGDERDVVFFSLAFSTNPQTGQLPLNFGPLSQAGGERRLNVAITRARRQVVLFASFDPEDIDLSRTNAVGTRHLKAYCEMAAAGVNRLGDLATGRHQRRDRIRDEVANAIRARGHEVTTDHGLSDFTVDIAVRRAGSPRWQVAVILDGPQWSGRPTVADRDGAPALLRGIMGWPELVRFWLPAWLRDRATILKRVDEAVERAVAAEERAAAERRAEEPAASERQSPAQADGPPATSGSDRSHHHETVAPAERQPTEDRTAGWVRADDVPEQYETRPDPVPAIGAAVLELASPAPVTTPTWQSRPAVFVPYVPTLLGSQEDLDAIRTSGRVQAAVRTVLRDILATEGPVKQHRLARLALSCFGFAKTHEDRRNAVLDLLDPDVLVRRHPTGGFAWPPGLTPDTWREFRQVRDTTHRDLDEVVPEEIANAASHALTHTSGMAEQDLMRSTLELLGYRRLTGKATELLRYGLEVGRDRGRIVRDRDGRYRLDA